MLVKDGVKNSYVAGGILQIVLGLIMGFLLIPITLRAFDVDTGGWYTLVYNDIFNSSFGPYVLAAINFFVALLFLISFIALFFRNSLSSLSFKLSALISLFMLGALGLDLGMLQLDSSLGITDIFSDTVRWILVIASGVFFVLGFVFQFTLSRKNPNRANTYQAAKALILLAIVVINFLIQDILYSSDILVGIFGFIFIPYFCSWYFLIMGIWQLISSPKLVDPTQTGYYGGYPQAPYGPQPTYPQAPYGQPQYQQPYVQPQYPQQPYGQPYMPYPPRPAYGPMQGIADKKAPAETPKKVEEIKPTQQAKPELPKVLPPKLPPKLADKQTEISKVVEKPVTQPSVAKIAPIMPKAPVAPKVATAPKATTPKPTVTKTTKK